jgi:peptidoglycan hydrolase CwlO-like protein
MPIQPLEIYDVEETGELVLKHKDLKDALITSSAVMIVNHEDKSVILWIGRGSSTRIKFAAARSSRRLLTERGLSYRVKTCDEGDEPDWFQALFTMKVTDRSRDEPPTLEVLSILNEMKAVQIPEGFEREACIISRDFYVPVEYKSSVMGTEKTSIKFEKGSYLPEGLFMLPSGAYCPRLLVKNGKVLGIDILINQELAQKDAHVESLQQESNQKQIQSESLQANIKRDEEEIKSLKEEIIKKDDHVKSIQKNIAEKEEQIEGLQEINARQDKQIEALQNDITQKDQELGAVQDIQSKLKEKDQRLDTLQNELIKKEQRFEALQNTMKEQDQQIETLQNTVKQKEQEIETFQGAIDHKNQQIEELTSSIEDREQKINEQDESLKQKEAEFEKERKLHQETKTRLEDKIKELESVIEPNPL